MDANGLQMDLRDRQKRAVVRMFDDVLESINSARDDEFGGRSSQGDFIDR